MKAGVDRNDPGVVQPDSIQVVKLLELFKKGNGGLNPNLTRFTDWLERKDVSVDDTSGYSNLLAR